MERITLDTPIQYGETTIIAFDLRRPTLGDIRGIDKIDGQVAQLAAMIAKLAHIADHPDVPVTAQMIDRIDIADVAKLSGVIQDFLPKSLRTGRNE